MIVSFAFLCPILVLVDFLIGIYQKKVGKAYAIPTFNISCGCYAFGSASFTTI